MRKEIPIEYSKSRRLFPALIRNWRAHWGQGDKIRLFFDHVDGGLIFKRPVTSKFPGDGFVIAGEDRNFVRADAVIDGETILVGSPQVVQPVAVQFIQQNGPAGVAVSHRFLAGTDGGEKVRENLILFLSR